MKEAAVQSSSRKSLRKLQENNISSLRLRLAITVKSHLEEDTATKELNKTIARLPVDNVVKYKAGVNQKVAVNNVVKVNIV